MKSVQKALARRGEGEKGFTLVELLVVVIIIGILAAIAVPIYLNQRKAAWKASVESDVKNASLVVETAMTSNNGELTGIKLNGTDATSDAWTITTSGSSSVENPITVSSGNKLVIKDNRDNTYTITGTSDNLGSDSCVYTSSTGSIAWE